jgi:hypothetical protein
LSLHVPVGGRCREEEKKKNEEVIEDSAGRLCRRLEERQRGVGKKNINLVH